MEHVAKSPLKLNGIAMKYKKNFIRILLILLFYLFCGLVMNYYLMLQVPRYVPIMIPYYGPPITIEQEPIVLRFINYLVSFFTGDWGTSVYVYEGAPVTYLLRSRVPRMIEILIVPVIGGFFLGKLLGKFVMSRKKEHSKKILNLCITIGFMTPIIWFGFLLQRNFVGIFPVQEWNGYFPPLITGFSTLDSVITGNWRLLVQILVYSILPTGFLTLLITALFTKQTINNHDRTNENSSIISNTIRVGRLTGFIFMFYLIIDLTFTLRGFSSMLFYSIVSPDYFVLQGCMFTLLIGFLIIMFISNLIFIRKNPLVQDNVDASNLEMLENAKLNNSKGDLTQLKKLLLAKFKSPLSMTGVSLILFLVLISIFPQLITSYTLADITPPAWGDIPYAPPSPEHPLGTAKYGHDLLALVIFGIRDLLVSGGWTIIIGLIGGLPFGYIASKFNRSDKQIINMIMSLFCVFPGIVVSIFMLSISRSDSSVQIFIIGMLLIPLFTHKIAHTKPRLPDILRELIVYIPFVFVFSSLLYTATGFLGFSDYRTVQLGNIIHDAISWVDITKLRPMFWPGVAIIVTQAGFILLHLGLITKKIEL